MREPKRRLRGREGGVRGGVRVRVCVCTCVRPPQLPTRTAHKHNPRSRQGKAAGWLTPGCGAGSAEDGEQLDGIGLSFGHPWMRSRCFGPP